VSSSERDGRRPVQIAWASNPFEAELIKGFLEAEGVTCLQLASLPSDYRSFGRSSRRVFVAATDRDRAGALLAEAAEKDESGLPP
jgi:Putative prokaryotic signal transducing protein